MENLSFQNPLIWADVPDPDVIWVGSAYYMISTTMHFSPGCPIMKSHNLAKWDIVNYVYDTLEDRDDMNLTDGENAYGAGSWAASLRCHGGIYYAVFTANNTGKTYIYQTENIETGLWRRSVLDGIYHDPSLLFDDDGRVYMVYGGGTIRIIELNACLTGIKTGGLNQILIEKADAAGNGGLPAEGSHFYKINGKYYLFLIAWPEGGRRTQLCYRADTVTGPYEGMVVLSDTLGFNNAGVAQGGIVDTPAGVWYAMLFQDHGAVGRIPVLVPVAWEDGWPVFGVAGKVPPEIVLPADTSSETSLDGYKKSNIVTSDEFSLSGKTKSLAPAWQWNHNPDDAFWSLTERKGYLRITAGSTSTDLVSARNVLTQRTLGPICAGSIALETGGMNNGDVAGLAAFQERYGFVGVVMENDEKAIVMRNADDGADKEIERVPLTESRVYFKIAFDFRNAVDKAQFFYSLDGETWTAIGNTLQMSYRLTHFTGYRFALFYYATEKPGGYTDFDFFHQ
jgi:beta-xylosidase